MKTQTWQEKTLEARNPNAILWSKLLVNTCIRIEDTRSSDRISAREILWTIILLQAVCRFCTIRDCCDLSTHCGSCLVPKLNWQMHCNYKFYLLLWNCKGLHIKGKVNMLKADKISAGCQHLLKLFTFREQSSDNRRPVAFPAYLLVS